MMGRTSATDLGTGLATAGALGNVLANGMTNCERAMKADVGDIRNGVWTGACIDGARETPDWTLTTRGRRTPPLDVEGMAPNGMPLRAT